MPVPTSFHAAGVLLAVALAGGAVLPVHAQDRQVSGSGPTEPLPVRWRQVSDAVVYPRREAQASVLARNQSQVSAELSAVIKSIAVDVGQRVKAGDLLATLDPTDARLSLAQVQAQRDGLRARLRLAQSQLKRARELKTNNFVSTDAVNQRTAEVVSLRAEAAGADAQVAIAQRRLDKAQVKAPFDAVISARQAQLGELTSPGAPMFTMVELGGEQIAAQIANESALALERAPAERFYFQSDQLAAPLRLLRISPVITRQTRTREARFSFAGEPLPAGTEGRLVWQSGLPHLPPALMVQRNGELGVFTVQEGRAVFVPVPGAQEGRPARSELPPNMPVITEGQARLQSGQAVNPRPAGAS
ncbi:MAG: efflux RND transporter periplasmic adaptor subunit [Burkholderiaceae bacterium]